RDISPDRIAPRRAGRRKERAVGQPLWKWRVTVEALHEVLADRAHVTYRGRQIRHDLPLYGLIVLIRMGVVRFVTPDDLRTVLRPDRRRVQRMRKRRRASRQPRCEPVWWVSIVQIQKLIHQDLVIEHAEAAADSGFTVALSIPGKPEPRSEIQMIAGVRQFLFQFRAVRSFQEGKFAVDLGGYCCEFIP